MTRLRIIKLPDTVPPRALSTLVSTFFGAGRIFPAPGTWGTIASWTVALPVLFYGGQIALSVLFIVFTATAFWAVTLYEKQAGGDHDRGEIVADETAGIWLAMLMAGPYWPGLVFALFAFRLLDIAKPGPIGYLDRRVSGAAGVMLDDILAGFLAGIGAYALNIWIA